ncbi:MAG: trimethylamine methyltransferase [Spirochaetes bacterium]|nr:MAG: trimethylamine methyltransferase [Spirochaetota bacterium]
MYDRMYTLSKKDLNLIHNGSMRILKQTGVFFADSEVVELFKKHGFKVDGRIVHFDEKEVQKALETSPSKFRVTARNPLRSVTVGGDDVVFAPGYGAPFIVTSQRKRRPAVMEDYDNFCKLVHSSPHIDMNGFMMVEPADIPASRAHLHMLLSNIVLCDKAFMGSPVSRAGSQDALEMAGILWGAKESIRNKPVMVSLINSLSPLKFSEEMAGSLVEFALYGQPCIIASLIQAGASGPIRLAGVLTLQNAEVLAGLTLAQLVNPGTPIIYGSASAITDMRSGALAIGALETSKIISATAQIARYYNLPSRAGGSLTGAHIADMQAGVESTFSLLTAARNGINYILHSCGILNSFLSMSFEKFLLDEELCGMVKRVLTPVPITEETISVDTINRVGIGGEYLSLEETLILCREEFFEPRLMYRDSYDIWRASGERRADQRAEELLGERLSGYKKPDLDREIERSLKKYVEKNE